jgi:hypothetical protein
MKRCNVCQKLADNGAKRCQFCGTQFEYDPRVTPFSETKIILGLLTIILVGLLISNALPLKLPDPAVCSREGHARYKKIANQYYRESKNILRAELITSKQLSELMSYKNDVEDIPVPTCLEPAKTELAAYLNDFYYIALYRTWGNYPAATAKIQSAAQHWDALNKHLDQVKTCLPNCP